MPKNPSITVNTFATQPNSVKTPVVIPMFQLYAHLCKIPHRGLHIKSWQYSLISSM